MKKEESSLLQFGSLSDAHRWFGLPAPLHPLVSVIHGPVKGNPMFRPAGAHVLPFYKIAYKPKQAAKLKYGQSYYDFDEGGLLFAAPGQVVGGGDDEATMDCSSFALLVHPDFFLGYPLARKIKQYGYFSYSTNEALHLSEKEKDTVLTIFRIIDEELAGTIDDFSQDLVVSQIDLLLNYANRFYKRQFITRKAVNNGLLQSFEAILDSHFNGEQPASEGIPSVQYLAAQLHISPSYLSDMLRSLTGQNTQAHIHNKLIEKAKEKLSTTALSVSEVAYELGFEHPQSFNKLFKTKTKLSPLEFRRSFM